MTTPGVGQLMWTAALGLAAGLVGGLAGVGGSMVMIPGLHLVYGDDPASIHHVYMAAGMTVNVAVSAPAAIQHAKAGAVRKDLLPVALSSAILAMAVGVLISNRIDAEALKVLLGVAIILYCGYLALRTARNAAEPDPGVERSGSTRVAMSGGLAGLIGGLLGLGGGIVFVPTLQALCRVPMRQAIATSSAVICVTSAVGAAIKLNTLAAHGQSMTSALVLAALLAPTAIIGGKLGAKLTHALPLQVVRLAITVLLLAAALRLMDVW